jgi:hypothetical protein
MLNCRDHVGPAAGSRPGYDAGVSMMGEWLRVTPAELEQAMADPDWGQSFAFDTWKRELQTTDDVAQRRSLSTDKTWEALRYLLTRQHFPVDIVLGEHRLTQDDDVEWGYGRPRYLTVDEVRRAAAALAGLTQEGLLDGVTADDLTAADIYPDDVPWAASRLDHVRAWFGAAAADGDAVICYIQ